MRRLVWCIVLLGACETVPRLPAPPPRARPVEPSLPAPISATSCLELVATLPTDRSPGRPGLAASREWLVSRLEAMGYTVHRLPFEWDGRAGIPFENLEVRLGPRDGPLVVAAAHYDTVPGTHGADDNASGVATLLEVARRMARRELPAELRLVWFDAEELGLVGSRVYVEQLTADERQRLVGCVILESVGYTDRRPGSQRMPPGSELLHDVGDVADFLLVLGNQDSQDLAGVVGLGLSAEEGESLRAEVYSQLPGAGWVLPDSRRSDHASFWDAGLPAVMLTDTAPFRNPWYHRPGDVPQTLDAEFLAAVARGVERALLLLLADA